MKKIVLFFMVVLFLASSSAWAETVIIVNSNVSASIDADTVQKIYLGKKSKWDDGTNITPFDRTGGPVHEGFLETYIKKSSSQYSTYWKQMIFSGKGAPPKAFASDAEMVEQVSKTSGAIGYIDSATPHDGVNVVK